MHRKILIFSFLYLLSQGVHAQCGTDDYNKQLVQPFLEEGQDYLDYIDRFRDFDYEKSYDYKTKKAVRTIPVVFHIIHSYGESNISKAQIEDQMRIINEDFQKLNADTSKTRAEFKDRAANLNLEFKLATIAPDGSCTEGITRTYDPVNTIEDFVDGDLEAKGAVPPWDRNKYLNIWVVTEIRSNSEGTILGYAQFPGQGASTDGVVIRHDRVGTIGTARAGDRGRTLTHEIGHWLSLFHPFQGGCSNTNDRVADTPPVAEPSYGCPTNNNSCSNDFPDEIDNVENFMDYSNGSCMNMFTEGQKQRVEASLANNNLRGRVISASNLQATGVNVVPNCGPIADFWIRSERTVICQGGNVQFEDLSYNGEVTERTWTFAGGTPSVSTFPNPTVVYNEPGVYEVKLEVANEQGGTSITRSAFVTVLPAEATIKAPFGRDFSQQSQLAGWDLEADQNSGWRYAVGVGYSGNQCLQARISESTGFGARYSLKLPPIDIAEYGNPIRLSYRYAYARRSTPATEVLYVQASTNCGDNWSTIGVYNANNGLAVRDPLPNWFPSSKSDWAYNEIDLSRFANEKNLMLRFDVLSQSGNSVFIDDINIGQYALSVPDKFTILEPAIYPNPTQGKLHINYNGFEGSTELELMDVAGKVLLSYQSNQTIADLDLEDFPNGTYLLKIKLENTIYNKKLILNK
jgi:PKD repeat protein